ncbi:MULTISPECIES: hypothetical protein [unclassified Streptomyces]|uniref:hypothetical protein n=1 Tax=unclassified Streptomyces TaxID=2593676 RepID=UPI00117EA300|nr:hypothetical protein [Streptomyces sp. CB01883]
MSEQDSRADDFPRWLAGQGTDAYALAWAGEDNDPLRWMTAPAPAVGRTGADRPGGDPSRLVLQEITHGRSETLRRWLELEGDSTDEPLAIIGTADGRLREYTPGELVAHQLRAPGNDDVQLTRELADWVYRRQAQAPQGLEFGWTAAAAAWSWYMRDAAVALPHSVLARSLALAGEDDAVEELMVATTLTLAGLYDHLEHGSGHHSRAGFVDDWHAIEALAADVPELREPAGWLLDQIALRDASAQQLRAVLEPDITDYLHDRTLSDQHPDAAPPRLDGPRTAHLAQAREAVRAYTAAAYSGRDTEAQQLLDAFPVPARALHVSGPARTWREQSATARQAVHTVTALRATATATAAAGAESGADPLPDPERLHAKSAYLAARDAQLQLQHDALGRLAAPTPLPYGLPEELHEVAAHGMQRRLAEAFGSPERARQVIEGRITYHHQQSVAGGQRESAAEAALLQAARATLDVQPVRPAYALLDEQLIARRVDRIMSAPVPLPAYEPPSPGERQRRIQAQPSASSPDPGTGGLRP